MEAKNDAQPTDSTEKLATLVRDIKIAMMTTVDGQGHLRSRPMATIDRDFDGYLWFVTPINTLKVDEIERDERVNLSYAKPGSNSYVSVSGTARLNRDENLKKQLWKPEFEMWAPNGAEDPNIGLLQITVDAAEYWDAPAGAMVYLVGLAKAMVGKSPALEVAENAKVSYT